LINFVEELFNCEAKNMTDLKAEHEIGFSEGKTEGLSEGERNKAREIALKMLAKNKSLEEIAEFTGLTESEIHAASSFFQK
jgi:predicted transposase/invertase (TIGR01784 family)